MTLIDGFVKPVYLHEEKKWTHCNKWIWHYELVAVKHHVRFVCHMHRLVYCLVRSSCLCCSLSCCPMCCDGKIGSCISCVRWRMERWGVYDNRAHSKDVRDRREWTICRRWCSHESGTAREQRFSTGYQMEFRSGGLRAHDFHRTWSRSWTSWSRGRQKAVDVSTSKF